MIAGYTYCRKKISSLVQVHCPSGNAVEAIPIPTQGNSHLARGKKRGSDSSLIQAGLPASCVEGANSMDCPLDNCFSKNCHRSSLVGTKK